VNSQRGYSWRLRSRQYGRQWCHSCPPWCWHCWDQTEVAP